MTFSCQPKENGDRVLPDFENDLFRTFFLIVEILVYCHLIVFLGTKKYIYTHVKNIYSHLYIYPYPLGSGNNFG